MKKIPGPTIKWPLFGHINLLTKIADKNLNKNNNGSPSENFFNLMNKLLTENIDNNYNDGYIRLWLGPFVPIIIITDANIAQKLLNSKYHLDKATFYSLFRYAIKDGVFTSKTEKWLHQKREIQEHLKFKALQHYIINTERHLAIFNERIDQIIDDNELNGKIDDIKPYVSTFVLDVLGENLFNTQFHSQTTGIEPNFVNSMIKMLEISYEPFLKPWTYHFRNKLLIYIFNFQLFFKSFNYILNFRKSVQKIIKNRFEKRQTEMFTAQDIQLTKVNKRKQPLTLLDSMIEARISKKNPNRIEKYEEIVQQINTFVVAGHDTTTSAITWTLYLLGHHPMQQQRLIDEIDEFLSNLNLHNGSITLMNMRKLKYLECVILESLRMYPSGPFIARKSRQDLHLNDEIILPKNINYIIYIQHMHMNPKYFHQPEKFDPERFLRTSNDQISWVNHHAYIPFSGGHRMCLGKEYSLMQQRMFLINIFRRYRIKSLDNYGDCKPKYNFLLSSAHFPIQFERRQPHSAPSTPSFTSSSLLRNEFL